MKELPADIFKQLLDSSKLAGREADERLEKALDEAYWRGLAGTSAPLDPSVDRANAGRISAAIESFKREGVYRVDAAVSAATVARLNRTIDAVLAAGWPGVFAFACDELWECARLDPIRALVDGTLGGGAKQIPHVWTHIVKPRGDNAGWSPHVDGPGADRITVWLALSDAGVDNGCMYAVPRDPGVDKCVAQWCAQDALDKDNVKALLQGTRAMPASPGDLLGWAFDIIHWGGPVARQAPGRRSISFEFIGAGAKAEDTDGPLVALTGPLPAHADRIRAIAAAVLEYKKFEPLVLRYQDVAKRMMASLA